METDPNQILQSFKDFFDLQSTIPSPPSHCERCGSTMEYFNAHFSFYETEMEWTIPLPFCPSCDGETVPPKNSKSEGNFGLHWLHPIQTMQTQETMVLSFSNDPEHLRERESSVTAVSALFR